jgi:hypothetical protein
LPKATATLRNRPRRWPVSPGSCGTVRGSPRHRARRALPGRAPEGRAGPRRAGPPCSRQRSGRGAGAPGPAHGETPSPERTAPDLEDERGEDGEGDPEGNLAASAVSGHAPPAGPQWVSRLCAPRAAGSGLRQAAVRVAGWGYVARGDAGPAILRLPFPVPLSRVTSNHASPFLSDSGQPSCSR